MRIKPVLTIVILIIFLTSSIYVPMIGVQVKVSSAMSVPENLKSNRYEDGSNIISSLISLVDKNNNKIYDLLEKEILKSSDSEYEVVVILKDEDNGVYTWLENHARNIKKFSKAIKGFAARIKGSDIVSLANFDSVMLIQPNLKHRAFMHRELQLIRARPYIWSNYSLLGPQNFTIALLDSGIDPTHLMLQGWGGNGNFSSKIVAWYDAVNNISEPYDDNGHGTANAALIAGNFYDGITIDDNKVSIKFLEYGFVIDGYTPDYMVYYYDYLYVPEPGSINISIYWIDYSMQSEAVPEHHATINETVIFDPDNNEIARIKASTSPLNFTLNAEEAGPYRFEITFNLTSEDDDPSKIDGPGIVLWGFAFLPLESNDSYPYFAGVAPEAKLVGVKVLDENAYGNSTHILDGIEWVLDHKTEYKIVEAVLTFGSAYVDVAVETAVKNMMENGIVTVIAAGNYGPYANTIASPGRLDLAITVGASNSAVGSILRVPTWSSRGPYGKISATQIAVGNTTKPDIIAPGGDFNEPSIVCADTNYDDNTNVRIYRLTTGNIIDNRTKGINDFIENDFTQSRGTSLSTSIVGGAVALIIQAITNDTWTNWKYSIEDIKKIKSILLLTAWEITGNATHAVNRGTKDTNEGYGLIQVDAAIEAVTMKYTLDTAIEQFLTAETMGKHVWARKVFLEAEKSYVFRVSVPNTADFDLYLWSNESNNWGEPVLVASSIHDVSGKDEYLVFKPTKTGTYYITIKAIRGEGNFVFKAYEVSSEEIENLVVFPRKASLVETNVFTVQVSVSVVHSFVQRVYLVIGGVEHPMSKVWESDDGRSGTFKCTVNTGILTVNGKLSIITPLGTLEYNVSWYVIPYFTPMVASILLILGVVGALKYQQYMKRKKLERLKEIHIKAEEIAKEILEELKKEGVYKPT